MVERFPRFYHFRIPSTKDGAKPSPKGGVTLYVDRYKSALLVSVAMCSMKDTFSKSLGRRIAKGRMGVGMMDRIDYEENAFYEDLRRLACDISGYDRLISVRHP